MMDTALFATQRAISNVFSPNEEVSLRHCCLHIMDELDRMALKLAFDTEELRDLCTSEVIAYQELPAEVARSLIRRLADIRATSNILYLPVGKPAELEAAPPGLVVVKLHQNHHLLFSAAHQQVPILSSGNVNWESVTSVKLLKIGNDNDE
ncbi:hypothetical protein [Pseudomonas sp. LS-2]|uniref:hypothetical protein n=1 Tax=Pseudomonas sp. LS-2 TaxID=2315859 RepID=UPI000E743476|nr:hypothetical protein [Pseudomonas sp. LS-2]RJX77850.1 hypothetical protein D3M70_19465 [Pseudomonas sp. LS-2]